MQNSPVTNEVLLERLNTACRKIDRVLVFIEGTNDAPGMKVRVDRLEQAESRRVWTLRAIIGGVITLVGKAIYEALT